MKKAATWAFIIAFITLFIDWAILGIKLLDGNYDVIAEAYIGAVCIAIIFICILIKHTGKCPHCGKIITSDGRYCPYCGEKL